VTATELERLEALEAMVAALAVQPLATTPPITIGELTNVPAPGSQLAAQWAQDVSSRIVQRFPTTAALKAWAAPVGAHAVAVDTGILWRRVAAGWTQITPWTAGVAGVAGPTGAGSVGTFDLAVVTIPADPGGRIVTVSAFVNLRKYMPYPVVTLQIVMGSPSATNVVVRADIDPENDPSPTGGTLLARPVALHAGDFVQAATNTTDVKLQVVSAAPASGVIIPGGNAAQNRLDVTVAPRGR